MSQSRTTALIALLGAIGGAFAQSASSSTTTSMVVTTGSATTPASTPISTSPAPVSINSNLPQTAPLVPPYSYTVPSLSAIVSGATAEPTLALDTTYPASAQPSALSGVPPLPNIANLNPANYPALDQLPPTNSSQVQQWLSQIDFTKVPSYNQTDGTCSGTPGAINDGRCWWTCGGCTRATDITYCPTQGDWGLSYDDGPSDYTPVLLDYLNYENISTTFFIVGSRAISRPAILQSEYMAGHQLSVHTWSHPSLTTLTNQQIVAELGWTKQIIKDVTGVTPNTFRPPYGDIDDRVRAIAAQMGLTPIIWTSVQVNTTTQVNFDTDDWRIPGGTATGESSLTTFDAILNQYAPMLNTGFIVLEHDLYQQTVDLAVGYVLPMALQANKYKLKSIITCLGRPLSEAYIETSSNSTATLITSAPGGSTFYQANVGSQTGSQVLPSSGAANATGSASASAGASSRAAAPRQFVVKLGGVISLAGALLAVGGGMMLL